MQALEVASDLSTAVVSTSNLQQALQYRGLNATDTQLLYSSGGAGGCYVWLGRCSTLASLSLWRLWVDHCIFFSSSKT